MLRGRHAFAGAALAALGKAVRAAPSGPDGLTGPHKLAADWTFGSTGQGATLSDKAWLDQAFRSGLPLSLHLRPRTAGPADELLVGLP